MHPLLIKISDLLLSIYQFLQELLPNHQSHIKMVVSPKLDKPKILKWYALPLLKSNNFLTSQMIKNINQTTTFFSEKYH